MSANSAQPPWEILCLLRSLTAGCGCSLSSLRPPLCKPASACPSLSFALCLPLSAHKRFLPAAPSLKATFDAPRASSGKSCPGTSLLPVSAREHGHLPHPLGKWASALPAGQGGTLSCCLACSHCSCPAAQRGVSATGPSSELPPEERP